MAIAMGFADWLADTPPGLEQLKPVPEKFVKSRLSHHHRRNLEGILKAWGNTADLSHNLAWSGMLRDEADVSQFASSSTSTSMRMPGPTVDPADVSQLASSSTSMHMPVGVDPFKRFQRTLRTSPDGEKRSFADLGTVPADAVVKLRFNSNSRAFEPEFM